MCDVIIYMMCGWFWFEAAEVKEPTTLDLVVTSNAL